MTKIQSPQTRETVQELNSQSLDNKSVSKTSKVFTLAKAVAILALTVLIGGMCVLSVPFIGVKSAILTGGIICTGLAIGLFLKCVKNLREKRVKNSMERYEACIAQLPNLLEGIHPKAQKAFEDKNFNLLFRQAASEPASIKLLEFLLINAKTLSIDILSKGEKSGTALNVAHRYNNELAIELLKKHIPEE
jgi:hypothetical protein